MKGTPTTEQRADAVAAAALWLATGNRDKSRAAVPQVKERFGLTSAQAVEAVRESNLILARSQ